MISFLALRELTVQTDEISTQTSATSINSERAAKAAKAGLPSRVREGEWDQARVGDENTGLQQLKVGLEMRPQRGAGSSDGRAARRLLLCTQWACSSGFPWHQPRAGRRHGGCVWGGLRWEVTRALAAGLSCSCGRWVWCRECGKGEGFCALRDGYGPVRWAGVGAGTLRIIWGNHHASFPATTCAGHTVGPAAGRSAGQPLSLPGPRSLSLRVLGSGLFSSSMRWCDNGVRWL